MSPTTENSYKGYMGKTIICYTLTTNTIIILYSYMVTMFTCICTRVSKNSRSSTVYVHKESGLIWPDLSNQTLFWCRASIACSISAWPCYSSWLYMPHSYLYVLNNMYLAGPQLHVANVTYS